MAKIYLGIIVSLLAFLPLLGQKNLYSTQKEISLENLRIEVQKKDASDTASKDGFIYLKITGGSAPYIILVFSTTSPTERFEGNELKLENKSAGTYLFIIQDHEKEIRKETVTISTKK
jgi:hypothetical protein